MLNGFLNSNQSQKVSTRLRVTLTGGRGDGTVHVPARGGAPVGRRPTLGGTPLARGVRAGGRGHRGHHGGGWGKGRAVDGAALGRRQRGRCEPPRPHRLLQRGVGVRASSLTPLHVQRRWRASRAGKHARRLAGRCRWGGAREKGTTCSAGPLCGPMGPRHGIGMGGIGRACGRRTNVHI